MSGKLALVCGNCSISLRDQKGDAKSSPVNVAGRGDVKAKENPFRNEMNRLPPQIHLVRGSQWKNKSHLKTITSQRLFFHFPLKIGIGW